MTQEEAIEVLQTLTSEQYEAVKVLFLVPFGEALKEARTLSEDDKKAIQKMFHEMYSFGRWDRQLEDE